MKKVIFVIFLCVVILPISSQDKPIITVLDFATEGVSRNEMLSIISLFSSALFRTEQYTIIDISQRENLLKELEFSMSDCTDESCQLKVGKLLSAEAIVVGNIGRVGSKFILSAKMLETETGKTLGTADGIYDDLDGILADIDLLALRLSGLESSPAMRVTSGTDSGRRPSIAKKRYSSGIHAGLLIAVGNVGEIMGLGVSPLSYFSYNLSFPWGILGLGALTGVLFQPTNDSARYGYNLISVPAAVLVKYETASRFCGIAEISAGAAVNFVTYKDQYFYRDDVTTTKFFINPTIGAGYRISQRFGAFVCTSLNLIFFDGATYASIVPGLRGEINF